MSRHTRVPFAGGMVLVLAAFVSGPAASAVGGAEDGVREAFAVLQAAIKGKDAAKLWPLLDDDSQTDAERLAKRVKGQYKRGSDKDKAALEKSLGLGADEFDKLSGQLLIKTKVFWAKHDEIPDAKVTGVSVSGDRATLSFVEPDGDKEKLAYTRQDGKWKVALPMPTFK